MEIARMPAHRPLAFLLASPEPALLAAIEPILLAAGAHVDVVLSAPAALAAMTAANPPDLALLDVCLPGMETARLLAAARADASAQTVPILLIADNVSQEWLDRLAEGVIDDFILRESEPSYWQIRVDLALRAHRLVHELEALREASTRNAQLDRLTGVYNREALLAVLFRETDRVQRMNGSISLVLFDIDDFGHWNLRLGMDACDELLCQVVRRTARLLRSYDLFGRPGMDEFLVALPGCAIATAVTLAERLRIEVFSTPFRVAGESIRLSACFGLSASQGRSPVVVLREAEQALQWAKAAGPESIQTFGASAHPAPAPVTFLSGTSGEELLAW
jgi:two-component system, cell cycle response regulator